MRARVFLALFMLVASGGAAAQVNQCMSADGGVIYTDKSCEALGAVERPLAAPDGFLPRYRVACVRGLEEFIYELSSAVEVGDVNRLAALYDWQGISSGASLRLMRRLEAIAGRPLLQVSPVYPGSDDDAFPAPLPATGQAPSALRLDQTLADGATPASTTLWLRRDLGCWWVTL